MCNSCFIIRVRILLLEKCIMPRKLCDLVTLDIHSFPNIEGVFFRSSWKIPYLISIYMIMKINVFKYFRCLYYFAKLQSIGLK